MAFRFSFICDLLEALSENKPDRPGFRTNDYIVEKWFRSHERRIRQEDFHTAAFLSTLLPEKRTDRVYFIQEKGLRGIIGRALGLGRSRLAELDQWNQPGSNRDLADCVEAILNVTPNYVDPQDSEVSVEEIDQALHDVASNCHFSSPAVRLASKSSRNPRLAIAKFYQRLSPRDAKWLTRLILKRYQPVLIDHHLVYRCCHPMLPHILRVQDDFEAAGAIIQRYARENGVVAGPLDRANLIQTLVPKLGVKVGRQTWLKARSLKHCLTMGHGSMSCEEKIDGEYCQIHIDLAQGKDCIQIYSKSGKDSTRDRQGLHEAIRKSLKIGETACPLKQSCILEGELVVYSDREGKILGFEKIRKHVSRSGVFLGAGEDSQRHPWEHLMIFYYDILMLDGVSLLGSRHSERFQRLRKLISVSPGRSTIVSQRVIDFTRPSAHAELKKLFAQCIVSRGEGLVLKPDDPYFDFSVSRRRFGGCPIKLKKGYLQGFGDVGDFAVVAARYDAARAKTYDIPHLKFTHFYIGCLLNRDEALQWNKRPQFRITNVLEINAAQLKEFVRYGNLDFQLLMKDDELPFEISSGMDGGKRPSMVFSDPVVFDIKCFAFEKPPNANFWSPRFPGVSKIHFDRSWRDVLSFEELQQIAKEENEASPQEDSQELVQWAAALEAQSRGATGLNSQDTISSTPSRSSGPSEPGCATVTPSSHENGSASLPSPSSRTLQRRDILSMTPPKPSVHSSQNMPDSPSSAAVRATPRRKRPASLSQTTPRKLRTPRHSGSQPQMLATASSSWEIKSPPKQKRRPLGERDGNSASQDNEMPLCGQDIIESVPVDMSEQEDQFISVRRDRGHRSRPKSAGATPSLACAMGGRSPSPIGQENMDATGQSILESPIKMQDRPCANLCLLRGVQFLLAPCVSSMPWLTENLLRIHGVADPVSDPMSLRGNHGELTAAECTSASQHQAAFKKVALVESRRKDATREFLRQIEDADLKRPNGRHEFVVVFDWRVMEAVTKEERRYGGRCEKGTLLFDMNSPGGIWRKYWVGLV